MSQVDVRGLLQYVPQFRGKVFVIVVDAPGSALAEVMLDLVSLQNIGVQLVVGSTVHRVDALFDWAVEGELKMSQFVCRREGEEFSDAVSALQRGQAVFFDCFGEVPLSGDQAELAKSLGASKLILLHRGDERVAEGAIRAADVGFAAGPASLIQRAASACLQKIPRVHLLDGSSPAVLLSELFSNEGVGAMVYADSYREIRALREEDIVELLGMIARSVRRSRLVPRSYTDIEQNLDDYSVMVIDGNVVGCVALHCYPEETTAEVACLYVKQAHEGLGYGAELVRFAEQKAKSLALASVFSLTNRAAYFFQERMGYRELEASEIPQTRYEQLIASGRDSRVFGKTL